MTDSVYDLTQSYVDGDIDRQTLRRQRKLEIERLVRKHRFQATGHFLATHPILANLVNNFMGFSNSSIAAMRNHLFASLAVSLMFVSLVVIVLVTYQPSQLSDSNNEVKSAVALLSADLESVAPVVVVNEQHSDFTVTETNIEQEQAKTENSAIQTSTKKKSDDDSN